MFVTDAKGTILSIAYDEEVQRAENSSGRNFCYRTYFHGGRIDLPKDTTEIGKVEPLTSTHLSAAFPSTATRLWKVAVSTPIYLTEDRSQPDAMFVVTINLGDFELPQSKQGANQVVVLVEAREGPAQGTILQHPLMDVRRKAGVKMEGEKYQMSQTLMQRLLGGGNIDDYSDPLAAAGDGSALYAGPWIAAMQTVRIPRDDREDGVLQSQLTNNADLLVMVQYRLEKVTEPVNSIVTSLIQGGLAAMGSILVVTLTLWLFVRRVGAPSAERQDHAPHRHGTTETMSVS